MSIDVEIRQKFFRNKQMPLEVILGENLHYVNFVNDQPEIGELGERDFVAYNPKGIGRGFSVLWNPRETKKIALQLPHPSTPRELKDFFDTVERIVKYWDGKLIVDGNRLHLDVFMASLPDMINFNYRILKQFSEQIISGESDDLTLYSTMLPLVIGKEEAAMFLENPDSYSSWLHEKQSMDIYFAGPKFYEDDDGIIGTYFFKNNLPAVFPNQPRVPLGMIDPKTRKPVVCKRWLITLLIDGTDKIFCTMDYYKFLSLIPEGKGTRYDAGHVLVTELTEDEIRAFASQM
ncbi:MAG: DUF4299 family protein [Ruminococcaceae bacterium]|nr:DUF4299 family protein [Oscillospiraceae bacterium]